VLLALSPFLFVDGFDALIGAGHVRVGPNRWVHELFGDTGAPTPRGIRGRHGRGRFEFSKGLPTRLLGAGEIFAALGIWCGTLFAWRGTRLWEVLAIVSIVLALCAFFPAAITSFAM